MKKMKKLTSLLLAAVMVFGMAVTASANQSKSTPPTLLDAGGSITVLKPAPKHTYTFIKMFDLLSYVVDTDPSTDGNQGTYSYIIHEKSPWWKFVVDTDTNDNVVPAGTKYVKVDTANPIEILTPTSPEDTTTTSTYYVVEPGNFGGTVTGAAFAQDANTFVNENKELFWTITTDSVSGAEIKTPLEKLVAAGEIVTKTSDATGADIHLTDLEMGYYFMASSVGALCGLTTTNPHVDISAKNGDHTIDKVVTDDRLEDLNNDNVDDNLKNNNTYVGKSMTFTTTVTAGAGAENFVIHDRMSSGLTLDKSSIRVHIAAPGTSGLGTEIRTTFDTDGNVAGGVVNVEGNDLTYFTVNYGGECYNPKTNKNEPHTFDITFNNHFTTQYAEGTKINVVYNATLNENAVIGSNGNPNDTYLGYGDSHYTEESQTLTFTWGYDVFKFTNSEDSTSSDARIPLAGAVFSVRRATEGPSVFNYIKFVDITTADDSYPVYRVASNLELADPTLSDKDLTNGELISEFTTNSTGKFKLVGMDIGNYELVEISAPPGFNPLDDPIAFVIGVGGTVNPVSVDARATTSGNVIEVLNQKGQLLPQTGGMGTTIFYVLGSVLALSAGVLFVTKKRMGYED